MVSFSFCRRDLNSHKRRNFGKGEQGKTIEYRFFDAKELKQGVCRAECIEATADDYATRVGGGAASNLSYTANNIPLHFFISYVIMKKGNASFDLLSYP